MIGSEEISNQKSEMDVVKREIDINREIQW